MKNMQKRSLFLFFPQNEKDCFWKLKDSQQKEQPVANFHFDPCQIADPLELFTFPKIIESKSNVVSSCHVNCASDDLKNVVKTNEIDYVEGVARFHKSRSSDENKPQINAKNKQQNKRRNDMEICVVKCNWEWNKNVKN